MERIEQPKTAVPLEVQRVLDAMTEENFGQFGAPHHRDGDCFLMQASTLYVLQPVYNSVEPRCLKRYGEPVTVLNNTASSLSDFKSKITALYEVP